MSETPQQMLQGILEDITTILEYENNGITVDYNDCDYKSKRELTDARISIIFLMNRYCWEEKARKIEEKKMKT